MRVDFHRNFDAMFSKLGKKQKERFKERLIIFVNDQYATELSHHPLQGSYQGYRSINVTGDIRAIFILHGKHHVEFVAIGTHSKLYGE